MATIHHDAGVDGDTPAPRAAQQAREVESRAISAGPPHPSRVVTRTAVIRPVDVTGPLPVIATSAVMTASSIAPEWMRQVRVN